MVVRVKNEKVSVNTYVLYEITKQMEIAERYIMINTRRSLELSDKQKVAVLKRGEQIFDRIHRHLKYPTNARFSDENSD